MTFDWDDYLRLSKSLRSSAGSGDLAEAKLRCACSRAYYAAYCYARNHLRDDLSVTLPNPKNANLHTWVASQYIKRNDLDTKVGKMLKSLKKYRKDADYEDHISNPSKTSKASISLAESSISNIA